MCGIFAYTGTRTAGPILIEGLKTLEYRGYDSAGVYMPGSGSVKAVGPIANLSARMPQAADATCGIAHTRWATHGAPTEGNAHPHQGNEGLVWLVHNGIIENYRELKDELLARGDTFASDTDTEVLAHLIERLYRESGDLKSAVCTALTRVRGAYGIAVAATDKPEVLVAARMGSPIVIGISPHGNLIASDASALLAHTKDVIYLEDGEVALLTPDTYEIETFLSENRNRAPERIEWDVEEAKKGGYEHFMLKEIMEGPEVLRNSARGRLIEKEGRAKLGGLESVLRDLEGVKRMTIVGCGSAYFAGTVGKYLLERFGKIPTTVELASEYRYMAHVSKEREAVLAVSQSGETADTLASVREAKRLGHLSLGIVNTVGSSIARETDAGVYNHAGPEVGVASTKAFLSQLEVFALLSLFIGRERGMGREEGKEIALAIAMLPTYIEHILSQKDAIMTLAQKYVQYRDFLYIGRTEMTPIAYEGALKLKEISYVHAEGYAAGEMKHGPIAMIDESFPTVAIVPKNEVYEKMVSNIEEIRARRGPVLALATEGDDAIAHIADDVLYIPDVHPVIAPIVATVPLHLFAYYVGTAKGYNVDRPRNLAKSVTVE